jgi:hypothetical protein
MRTYYQIERDKKKSEAWGKLIGHLVLVPIICGFAYCYSINAWLAYAGKEGRIAWWQAALLGFLPVFPKASLPVVVITWLALKFI